MPAGNFHSSCPNLNKIFAKPSFPRSSWPCNPRQRKEPPGCYASSLLSGGLSMSWTTQRRRDRPLFWKKHIYTNWFQNENRALSILSHDGNWPPCLPDNANNRDFFSQALRLAVHLPWGSRPTAGIGNASLAPSPSKPPCGHGWRTDPPWSPFQIFPLGDS